jgi:hypothetical protein
MANHVRRTDGFSVQRRRVDVLPAGLRFSSRYLDLFKAGKTRRGALPCHSAFCKGIGSGKEEGDGNLVSSVNLGSSNPNGRQVVLSQPTVLLAAGAGSWKVVCFNWFGLWRRTGMGLRLMFLS